MKEKEEKEKITVKVTIDKETWEELMKKFPELRKQRKATAIVNMLNKLIYYDLVKR